MWWLMLGVLLSLVGEAASKQWANTGGRIALWVAIVAYSATQFPWYAALKERNHLAIMATIWCLAGVVGAVILGRFVFGEELTAKQWVGIVLAFAACWLLC